jgi:hypothetical protein
MLLILTFFAVLLVSLPHNITMCPSTITVAVPKVSPASIATRKKNYNQMGENVIIVIKAKMHVKQLRSERGW